MAGLAKKRKRRIIITSILLVLASLVGAFAIYVGDYYHADMEAIQAFTENGEIQYKTIDDERIVFEAEGATKGLIFYPGGKVEYTAYIPLMYACAEQGVLCVLVEMPFNLAVLDINAADGIQEQYPEIEDWYIGGHSLGGSMAASYLADNADDYAGLILLGAYSTADLSGFGLDVLSIYGSEDKVMNRETYDESKANLPADYIEVVIEGGCHAYFGVYGAQDGDGVPTISNTEQIYITAEAITDMINE